MNVKILIVFVLLIMWMCKQRIEHFDNPDKELPIGSIKLDKIDDINKHVTMDFKKDIPTKSLHFLYIPDKTKSAKTLMHNEKDMYKEGPFKVISNHEYYLQGDGCRKYTPYWSNVNKTMHCREDLEKHGNKCPVVGL